MQEPILQSSDLKHHWHPCSQAEDYTDLKPLVIRRASGSYIEFNDGKKIIDAISSWWCKSVGHNHPHLKNALLQQLDKFEHVMFANTTHETIVKLGEKLTNLMPSLDRIFYAGDGACAVEIAMKMSLHSRKRQGKTKRQCFASLTHAYHGETLGALSVTDIPAYKKHYAPLLFDSLSIQPLYVKNTEDKGWNDAKTHWDNTQAYLEQHQETLTAILVEPILQGAGGMKLYSQDFLNRLTQWAKQHDIHIIADEIMTGLGRTGKMLACQHANIEPDFICLGKGLTGGFLPFSSVLTSEKIYDACHGKTKNDTFLHSHTYSGNALGASLALAMLEVLEKENLCQRANTLSVHDKTRSFNHRF